jgi:hypothetical protein
LAGVALKVYPVEPAVIFGAVNGFFKSSPCAAIIENDKLFLTNGFTVDELFFCDASTNCKFENSIENVLK